MLAVGLMSGTSLDGMDAALVQLEGPTHCRLVQFASRPYARAERDELAAVLDGSPQPPARLARLHVRLAEWAAEAIETLLATAQVKASALSFIAFPGQTIWHEPPLVSWQLGEPAVLAERFGVRVVSAFRSRDVSAGGQGAPLVPIADLLLFGHPEHARVLLNIGGMANLTYVARQAVEDGAFAFDTGPGMAVIDGLARMVKPDWPYDRDGLLAREGRVDEQALEALLSDPFFDQPPPRSTGRERFGQAFVQSLAARVPGPDGVATAVELTARSISGALGRWVPGRPEVVVSGGGAHHPVLLDRLRFLLEGNGSGLIRFDEIFFSGDAKEAVAFALLGYLTVHGQPGNLPAATGARGPRVLGAVTPP